MTITLKGSGSTEWTRPSGCPEGFEPRQVLVGHSDGGGMALEVAITRWTKKDSPTREQLARLHTLRLNQRATPLVLIVELSGGATFVFGPNTSAAPLGPLPEDQTQRVVQAALDEPNVLTARARLTGLVEAIDSTAMSGMKNSGLFANHELRVGVPQRSDWSAACVTSVSLLSERGQELIKKLGFQSSRAGAHALLLTGVGPRPHAIAVLLDGREGFDADSSRFAISPVAYGLKMAAQHGVPWLLMVRGTQLRLYPARIDFGVGRKGLAETFCEVDLPQLTREDAGYLTLIFSASALAEGGTTHQILQSSAQYAVALGARLRDKVYEEIVPSLSVAVAEALQAEGFKLDAKNLDLAYQLTLRVFFRMLFQVYAEDRKLLPFGENAKYDRNAIKTIAKDLAANPDEEFDPESSALWDDLAQVWSVIDSGDKAWGVPPYNGGLFSSDKELNEHGAILKGISITNDVMGPVLTSLLLDTAADGTIGPIDFRALSVREFGTIYEGLLESSLGLAEVDLTLDDEGTWVPAKKRDAVYAAAGTVYFHNNSGQRKGTGSYFTPSFVVEHLLERALDPALDAHLAGVAELISNGDQAGAAERFFDFRVADLAMGSGHFLTAAIDHIEQRMAAFLAEDGHFIPGVAAELQRLEQAAREQLGAGASEPERSSLLRRQIARRCIYGLDINPIAVELARVSIWIHTFVRGLPMSSLDHNLVCANSLTGIGGVEEALDVLVPGRTKDQLTLFDAPIEDALNRARTVLIDASSLAEATKDETRAASRAARKARAEAEEAKLLFDAAVLTRIGQGALVGAAEPGPIAKLAAKPAAQEAIAPLKPGHMPVLFPEVFLRMNGGFDVLIGNPPWEKLHVEEHQWWGLRFPGLRSMPMAERTRRLRELQRSRPDLVAEYDRDCEQIDAARRVVAAGPFPGIGSGHIDLYKAFAWRNWHLLRRHGAFGLVLPRGALAGSGTQLWRRAILAEGSFADVVVTVNTGHWVFANVHPQYSTAMVVVSKSTATNVVRFVGPFHTKPEFLAGRNDLIGVPAAEFSGWSATAAFPLLPDAESGVVFRKMRTSPQFNGIDGIAFRPVQGDLNSVTDKALFNTDLARAKGEIRVLSGSSFNLWNPSYGDPYAIAGAKAEAHILAKTLNSASQKRSAFYGIGIRGAADLPMKRARIAFRDICRATDSRTMVVSLVPPDVILVHPAPYLVRREGDERDEAFVLAIMASIPFDWYCRRLVELHMTFELLERMPLVNRDHFDSRQVRLVEIAGRLASPDSRFAQWAGAVGVPIGSVKSENERTSLEAEIDAIVAHLYGLSRHQVEHVFQTFHRGWDYASRLSAVLRFYDALPRMAP